MRFLHCTELPEEQLQLILGGEAAIWSEYVDNTNVLPRFFPFVNAVAERLWSPMNSSTTDDAMWRLDEQRCRMNNGKSDEIRDVYSFSETPPILLYICWHTPPTFCGFATIDVYKERNFLALV